MKKKKLYEAKMEQLGNFELQIHDQITMTEGAKATTDIVDVLRKSASALKSNQQSMNVDDIEKNIEKMNEHSENMKQI
ncbi:Vacuolar sorting-associated protein [Nymphaea thermarum]|nr:Vacuolar sorting-associated protein [Nymphaea thermarum]